MNRKILIIIILFAFALITASLILFSLFSATSNQSGVSIFQQLFGGKPNLIPLKSMQVTPIDNSTNIPTNQKITITFNRPFQTNEVIFSISPNIQYHAQAQGNTLVVIPNQPLQPAASYLYFLDFPQTRTHESHIFITTSQGATTPSSDNIKQLEDIQDLKYAPDVYLSNQIDSNNNPDFSITYDYTPSPAPGHFFFTVTINSSDQTKGRQEFIDWLHALKLTDDQIKNLDIRYK